MKQVLILIAIFISCTASGQGSNPAKKIFIGFSFSPDHNCRTLRNGDGNSSTDLVIKSRNDNEIARFGYTTGLNVYFNLSQHTGFETGVQFSNKGYKTKNRALTYNPPNTSLPSKSKSIYSYQYIGIPLKARFSFGKSKVHFITGIGFITNFLINVRQSAINEYSNRTTEKKSQSSTSGFKSIDISPVASLGIDYRMNNKMHLFTEPTFRYGLIKTKDAPVTENLWSTGLNIGFYYAIK